MLLSGYVYIYSKTGRMPFCCPLPNAEYKTFQQRISNTCYSNAKLSTARIIQNYVQKITQPLLEFGKECQQDFFSIYLLKLDDEIGFWLFYLSI